MNSARAVSILLFPMAVAAFVACGTKAAKPIARSLSQGIYTETQAKRGSAIYDVHCVECHAEDLSGDTPYNPSPQLAGRAFLLRWDKKNMDELFTLVRTQMPKDKAGTLKPEEYADVLAFVLQSNRFPAADTELTTDLDVLHQVRFAMAEAPHADGTTNTSQ